ncbi:MAG: adenylate/guanylate cyclase domain-containing protein [Magnetococcus sp. YQC-5]
MYHQQIARLFVSLGVTLLFFLHALNVIDIPLLSKLELFAYDARLKISMPSTQDRRIVIIALDEKSLAKMGRWPWGRHHLAKLTDILFDHYRILTLGYDVVFAEPDESSGLPVLNSLAAGPLKNQQQFLTEFQRLRPSLERDERFAKSMRGRPVMLGYYFKANKESDAPSTGTLPEPVISLEELGSSNITFIKAEGFASNISILQSAAQNGGFFSNPVPGPDGVNRRFPLLQEYQGNIYQSLSLSLVRAILGDPPVTLGIKPVAKSAQDMETGLEWIGLGAHHIPVDQQAAVLIPYRGYQGSFPYVSALDVFNKSADAALLADAIVLVGATAPGLGDRHATPVANNGYPGVEMHANIISGILDGVIKRRSAHAVTIELFYFLVIAVTMILLMSRLSKLKGFYLTILILLLIGWSNAIFWRRSDMVIPIASPVILTLLLFVLHNIFILFSESSHKFQIARMFGLQLSPALLEELNRKWKEINVSGERREMTILMANIQGFSVSAEAMQPVELVQFMNTYHTNMVTIIHTHQGALDQSMGDRIMAYWGAPLLNPKHARNCLQTVMKMSQKMKDLEDEFQAKGWPKPKIGIGVNTGMMHVGNMGSDFRTAYTVLGEAVSHASHLESLTKRYGVTIIVGEETRKSVPEAIFRELDRIRVKGHEQPVSIFEPVGFVDEVGGNTRSEVDAYHKAVALYRGRRWEDAKKRFQLLLQRDPERIIYEIYLSRVQYFMKHPPDANWDGVFVQSVAAK